MFGYEKRWYQWFGMMVVFVGVIQLSGMGWATSPGKTAGKVRSKTGVIMKMDKDVILLEVSSKKSLAVAIVPDSRIESERSASIADIVSGAVVKVTGDGKGSELLARKIILLAQGESVSYLKKAKTGTAFGDTMQSVNCKAQVVSQEPLVVKNRGQQTIQVALAKKHTLLKRVGVDKTALHVGDRVQIRYYDGPEPLLAKEILVYLPDEETK